MGFDELFDSSGLPLVLKQAKTLSKEECRAIYNYMKEYKPKVILEFGTQFGCSTRVFLELANWLGRKVELHSWDIVDQIKPICVDKNSFTFHKEDMSGREEEIVAKYNPDMLFLDAHPYSLTKNLMQVCLKHKINFLTHDVALKLYESLQTRSDNFKNLKAYGAWELYILAELFGDTLLTEDHYEDEKVQIDFTRDLWGLSIILVK